jgi:hypothetical protein
MKRLNVWLVLTAAILACGSIAQTRPKSAWLVAVSSEQLSMADQAKIEEAARKGTQPDERAFLLVRDDLVRVIVPRSDPALASSAALLSLWTSLAAELGASDNLDGIPLPEGAAGKEIRNLIRFHYPDMGGLDSPQMRMSVTSTFRVATPGSQGVAWEPAFPPPPASPAALGSREPTPKVDSALAKGALASLSLHLFVPETTADKLERGKAVGRAMEIGAKLFEDAQKAADSALARMFATLADKQKAGQMNALVGKQFRFGEMPAAVRAKLKRSDSRGMKSLESAAALKVTPYLTFLFSGKDRSGEATIYSISIFAPTTKPIGP